MALPSARRPRTVQEVLEKEQAESIKLVLRKEEKLCQFLVKWYEEGMTERERERLTRKRLKRRILYEAFHLKLPINKIPANYVQILRERCGMVLYKKIKTRKERYAHLGKPSSAEIRRYGPGGRNGTFDGQIVDTVDSAAPKPPKVSNKIPEEEKKVTETLKKVPKRKPKKMIDLTNETPPGWWLQAFAKGTVLPRKLEVYSDADMNIIFYDYEVDPASQDSEFKVVHHDRILKFDWWKSEHDNAKRVAECSNARSKGYSV